MVLSRAQTINDRSSRAHPTLHGSTLPCPLCEYGGWTPLFSTSGHTIVRCARCRLVRSRPVAPTAPPQLAFDAPPLSTCSETFVDEQLAATAYCDLIERNHLPGASLLAASPRDHPFLAEARRRGHRVDWLHPLGRTNPMLPPVVYDAAIVIFRLEQSAQPLDLLRHIHAAVRPGGLIVVVTPSLDSRSARLFGKSWFEWRPSNVFYFDRQTLRRALARAGFDRIRTDDDRHARRTCSLATIVSRPIASRLQVRLPATAMVVTARRTMPRPRPLLSVIMPVYNERPTFETTFAQVMAKRIPGLDKEIIVVESNSTDGTREVVLRCAQQPGVAVLLQDHPRGKGNAVREGLEHATGDFVIIQDADGEYDVDDYEALIEPLRLHQRAFVLGSRHTGDWKLRQFQSEPGLATFFNLGHLFFLSLFNVLYGQRLTDPFTMYKVFRRDCLENIILECDRFDFDFELVIKLIRQGYDPLEVPVRYHSRSFAAGKKVSALRDPPTWIRALVKYRFGPGKLSSANPAIGRSCAVEPSTGAFVHPLAA